MWQMETCISIVDTIYIDINFISINIPCKENPSPELPLVSTLSVMEMLLYIYDSQIMWK